MQGQSSENLKEALITAAVSKVLLLSEGQTEEKLLSSAYSYHSPQLTSHFTSFYPLSSLHTSSAHDSTSVNIRVLQVILS